MNWRLSKAVNLAGAGRIPIEDARRQSRTAGDILRRFDNRPGVILADEVGMGKTYVALAVAASVIEATRGTKSVVVMSPASVQDKWPREWEVFEEKCLKEKRVELRASRSVIRNGAEFLKLLDDPHVTRKHLIFLTHGALTSSLADPYIKLAIVRRALSRPSLATQRKAFPRWAGKVFNWYEFGDAGFVRALLEANPRTWKSVYFRFKWRRMDDEPVPAALLAALKRIDLSPLVDALGRMPLRESSQLEARLRAVRYEISTVLSAVWKQCLARLDAELPLLVLDEAHHLKNPGTRLAGLFASPEAEADVELLQGPLAGVFDRMLFLTATPFQLGHQEVIQVLRRFSAVRWSEVSTRSEYEEKLDALQVALDSAQRAALRLDTVWGRLRSEDLADFESTAWWKAEGDEAPERLRQAAAHFEDARAELKAAERLLKPWVIRHARADKATRRRVLTGRAIVDGEGGDRGGLRVGREAVLPFLLAARMQSLAAAEAHQANRRTRAYFAEGLASSFEAYTDTRLDEDAEPEELASDQMAWYERQIRRALPVGSASSGAAHPKIEAVAQRATELWGQGEKVLIFCFYRATGRALRTHIARSLRAEIIRLGAERMGLEGRTPETIADQLRRRADRFFDPNAPVARVARGTLEGILAPSLGQTDLRERCVEVALRFLRTPLFLVRYVDLGAKERAAAFERALTTTDGSGRSLHDKIQQFGEYVADRIEIERAELLDALEEIPTGAELLVQASERARDLFPNVRLANGAVDRATRKRLMLTFNTPFFPDVLIASAVMSEGVDLHIDCRYVIHHDLDWNPSVLEQRTGRVDRLGGKSELSGHPIVVYEPFLEATQDEKQFRVVKDRERWFNVVMGEKLELDEWTTDRMAERVELPEEAAQELAFRLEVVRYPVAAGYRRRKRPWLSP